jgi:hypothetical protein
MVGLGLDAGMISDTSEPRMRGLSVAGDTIRT